MGFLEWTVNKLNPVQPYLSAGGNVTAPSTTQTYSHQQCYEQLEVVNRAVNMLADDVAAIKHKVAGPLALLNTVSGVRKKTLEKLLNKEPNPYQDIDSFKRNLLMDFLLEGNMFMYYDGVHLYQLPATKMVVVADAKTFVSHYTFDNGQRFETSEIIHVKDNSYKSIYRGSSRLEPALRTMRLIIEMRTFQDNFFKNGAVPGLVLKSENTLNERLKKRLTDEWSAKYRPSQGGRRPIILDGGLEIDQISNTTFKDLDFQEAIKACEETVLKALGIPPILIDSGNNANIRPNHRIFYLETILPIVNKMNSAFERFFGFEIYEDTTYIEALRPELRNQAAYYQALVNGGIITTNEARTELGRPALEGFDNIRVPANIAGSAVDPSQGGSPPDAVVEDQDQQPD